MFRSLLFSVRAAEDDPHVGPIMVGCSDIVHCVRSIPALSSFQIEMIASMNRIMPYLGEISDGSDLGMNLIDGAFPEVSA